MTVTAAEFDELFKEQSLSIMMVRLPGRAATVKTLHG